MTDLMESLECRTLFSALGPQVTTIVADNRGQVKLTFSQALNASTVNANTVRILTAGTDGVLDTADDVAVPVNLQYSGNTLYITANTPANKLYRVEVLSGANGLLGKNKRQLYGNSGPGGLGGNFEDETTAANFVVRYNTTAGVMNVALSTHTPITNQNFVNYANSGAYDASIFHRIEPSPTSSSLFVLQGGGFTVENTTDSIHSVTANTPIPLETGGGSNLRGTIAMARTSNTNTGTTSEFFFNTQTNTALDPAPGNPGYAVFGAVTDAPSHLTLDKLANPVRILNLNGTNGGAFGELPVINYIGGAVDPIRNLEVMYRVAFLMDILPTIQAGQLSPAATRATAAVTGPRIFSNVPVLPHGANFGGSLFAADHRKGFFKD